MRYPSLHPSILFSLVPVVNQFYKAEILTEYVIRGNTAVLKCSIPSFVADYVAVEAWIADDGTELKPSNEDYGNLVNLADTIFHFSFVSEEVDAVFGRVSIFSGFIILICV